MRLLKQKWGLAARRPPGALHVSRDATGAGPRRVPPLVACGGRAVGAEKSRYQRHVESYNPEPTRRAKLVARAASGRAGLAAAGDLAGAAAVAGDLVGLWQGPRDGGAVAGAELWRERGRRTGLGRGVAPQMRKTGDPKAAGCLCVMGDLNPQPAD